MKTTLLVVLLPVLILLTVGSVYTPTIEQAPEPVHPDKQALIDYFFSLTREQYTPHPDYTLPQETILTDNQPSDCQDRAYSLAWRAQQLGYTDIKLLHIPSHIACLIDGRVWDPTLHARNGSYIFYDYSLEEYKYAFQVRSYWINDYKGKEEE